jgi:hypothetical protein
MRSAGRTLTCWSMVVFVVEGQWLVINAEFARPIGAPMPKGLALRDPGAAAADEGADCFLVCAMMQDPRCKDLVSGVEGAQQLTDFLHDADALRQRRRTATRALGMSFFRECPGS